MVQLVEEICQIVVTKVGESHLEEQKKGVWPKREREGRREGRRQKEGGGERDILRLLLTWKA